MSDISMAIKAKILAHLDSDPDVTSLVPSSSLFPMKVSSTQTPPFVRYGPPTVRPYEDWCGSGSEVEVTLHCYAMGETLTQQIAAAVQKSLRNISGVVDYTWLRTQFRPDPDEADAWDGMVTIQVTDR